MFRGKISRIYKILFLLGMVLVLSSVPARAVMMSEGAYRGTFIGDRFGSFVLQIDRDGYISGELFFNKTTTAVALKGMCSQDSACEFSALDGTMVFRGRLDQFNRFLGKWLFDSGEQRGSFYGMKQ